MARLVDNTILDAALDQLQNNASQVVLCSSEPSSFSDATTDQSTGGAAVGEVSVTSTDFTGPSDGDTSGRKIQVNAQTVTIDVSSTATHVAIVSTGSSVLQYVTTSGSVSVSTGETRDIQSWDIEIEDPSAP